MRDLAVCILAAGKGKRMGDPERAKVLTLLDERPLLGYVLECANALTPRTIVVIVGHQRDAVRDYVHSVTPSAAIAIQDEQLGTGHAVMQTKSVLGNLDADVIILSGDVPLLTTATLLALLAQHTTTQAALTILTTVVADPSGYGRILRDGKGAVVGIIEHKDANEEQLTINEINSGIYVVRTEVLFDALDLVKRSNAQGEFYLTDIAEILLDKGLTVSAFATTNANEVHGINTPTDMIRAFNILHQRV